MTKEIDLLNGSLWKNILLYSVPLMFSNVLQVLFNMADVIVVGRFAGTIALGNVGSCTVIVQLVTGIMFGLATGINAIVAFHIGAREDDLVKKAMQSGIILSLILGLSLAVLGIIGSKGFLSLLSTKDELIQGATLYLKVYLLASPGIALYNYGNAILTAVGETKRPLIYLSIAGAVNIVLNLIFVIVFKLSVLGVALATVISQYLSAFLIIRYIVSSKSVYKLDVHSIKLDKIVSKEILRIGIPASCQHALFSLSNLFVQSSINYFPHQVVEGSTAAGNADNIVYDMMAAFYTACTSFIAQNLGAKKIKRIKSVYLITMLYSFSIAAILSSIIFVFRIPFLHMFTTDNEVVMYGEMRLKVLCASFAISAFMDDAAAGARGLGKSLGPTIIVVIGTIIFRVIWIYTVFQKFHTITSLFLLYPCSWVLTLIIANIYFYINYKKLKLRFASNL